MTPYLNAFDKFLDWSTSFLIAAIVALVAVWAGVLVARYLERGIRDDD